ncbi:Protein MtfA [Anatilimnocola aggregata]|uniref:Protein MtfA n=1 Tax=Anatilimnocola aggregata TaxID=2528021 RepID=A0A517Y9S8_9BACT|nr:M90 family metallopeptidase [Anatilimnocola aggregata]QDU26984.1 Protein MtfA [Anatilimnocola aggregata]
MFFPWGRRARRQKLLQSPVPALWEETLEHQVPLYGLLPADLRTRLIGKARIVVAERIWGGGDGLAVTEEMKIVVAAQAVVLLAGDEGYLYERLPAIQLYPEYIAARPRRGDGGPHVGVRLGDSWQGGNVRLSWPAVFEGAEDPQDGSNVVFHEMAHHLDSLDGQMGGEPPLTTESLQKRWPGVKVEFQRLVQQLMHNRQTWLDPYAAESPAEFFAVVTEAFFEEPAGLAEHHPELFTTFAELYRVDPRAWFEQ